MTQLIDLELLAPARESASCLVADQRLDELAEELASFVWLSNWNMLPAKAAVVDDDRQHPSTDRYELPDGYILPTEEQVAADLEQLIVDLELAVRRARRDRWLAQVVTLPT